MGLFDQFKNNNVNIKEQIQETNAKLLIEIARIVTRGSENIMSEIADCISDTKTYFYRHIERFQERGINEFDDKSFIQWISLVDILEKTQYVFECDWKEEKEGFVYGIQSLFFVELDHLPAEETWFDETEDVTMWCMILDDKWRKQGIGIYAFDIDSDSYVLFPCKTQEFSKLRAYAKQLGFRIDYAKNM